MNGNAGTKRSIDPHIKEIPNINQIRKKLQKHQKIIQKTLVNDLSDPKTYNQHANIILNIGQNYLKAEGKSFDIDENNDKVLKFLLYYFNGCELAESVFPDKKYKLHKNIILGGEPGTGKTLLMQIFSEYLKIINNPNFFHNLSVTQMMNYYKIHSHIDKFTFNEGSSSKWEGDPFHVCLNDIGIETQNQKHFGTNVQLVVDEFLFARYEIYQNQRLNYHITTNLTVKEFKEQFEGRLIDRFKSFNVIPLTGKSRRT